jgi:hypothetical protein
MNTGDISELETIDSDILEAKKNGVPSICPIYKKG